MINIIKRRFFIGLFLTAVIMATIKGSVHAYNILSFAIPVLFVITIFILLSKTVRKECIKTAKAKIGTSTIGNVESCIWNLSIILLLAAFGHWFLAMLWFISWLIFFGARLDAMKEKNEEEKETRGESYEKEKSEMDS